MNELGVDIPERLAATCWLGVPLLAGQQALGVMTVHSHSAAEVYDSSHQEVLVTIAAQAAVAIQNARLYTRTDEALARRVQELDSILRTTSEGILLLAPNWHILAANRALADLLGLAQSELTGDLRAPRPDGGRSLIELIGYTGEGLQADCQALTASERVCRQTILAPGSPKRYMERTLTPVRNPQGVVTGWLLMFRDVTEEHELALLREELTHMLIHDLRSPLTVLTNSLEFIKGCLGGSEGEELTSVLALAEKAGDRMLHLINNLLDINKLESGQLSLQREAVDVRSLLENGAAELAPLAAQAQISVEISADSDLPPLDVDPGLINRVICNLLDNAIKFTPDGGHIRLWARPESTATMLIGVSDNGPGIPPEAQARLFKKFEQVLSTEGRRSGTGLGLPFCRLAVEAHGGQIWVESAVGKGSTFFVRLPVVGVGRD